MENNILIQFLESQLLPIEPDDTTFSKLEEAAEMLANNDLKKLENLPRFILAGMDPQVSEEDNAILAAKQRVSTQSRTIISQSTDSPITLLRAIILQALAIRVSNDSEAQRFLWLVGSSFSGHYLQSKEEARVIDDFLIQIGNEVEKHTHQIWTLGEMRDEESIEEDLPDFNPSSPTEPKLAIKKNLFESAMTVAGRGKNPSSTFSQSQNWTTFFVDHFGKGLEQEVKKIHRSTNAYSKSLSIEVVRFLKKNLENSSTNNHVIRQFFQSQLLWWKESLYSKTWSKSYRKISKPILPAIIAFDIVSEFPIPYPTSVNYFVRETFSRLVPKPPKVTFQLFFEGLLNSTQADKERFITVFPKTGHTEGRHLLSQYCSKLFNLERFDPESFTEQTGLDPTKEIDPKELCIWFFNEFQVLKLARK